MLVYLISSTGREQGISRPIRAPVYNIELRSKKKEIKLEDEIWARNIASENTKSGRCDFNAIVRKIGSIYHTISRTKYTHVCTFYF